MTHGKKIALIALIMTHGKNKLVNTSKPLKIFNHLYPGYPAGTPAPWTLIKWIWTHHGHIPHKKSPLLWAS